MRCYLHVQYIINDFGTSVPRVRNAFNTPCSFCKEAIFFRHLASPQAVSKMITFPADQVMWTHKENNLVVLDDALRQQSPIATATQRYSAFNYKYLRKVPAECVSAVVSTIASQSACMTACACHLRMTPSLQPIPLNILSKNMNYYHTVDTRNQQLEEEICSTKRAIQ